MDKKIPPKPGLSWLGLSWFFGSKLLVYRHAAETSCHMAFVCLKLTYHRGVAKNTLRLPEAQIELKLSKRPNTV